MESDAPREASYNDARLAAIYDPLNPWDRFDDYYVALAGDGPLDVLDLGCGTGRLSLGLAAAGHRVTGADPSPTMLAVARAKPGAGAVRWIEATAGTLDPGLRFDLVIMTGHAFQCLLVDADIAAALAAVRERLKPGGRFAFENRNAKAREWESWVPEKSRETVKVAGVGAVEVHNDIARVEGPLVDYVTVFRFPDGEAVRTVNTIRFMGRDETLAHVAAAGFAVAACHGDWDGSPALDGSPETIVVAQRP